MIAEIAPSPAIVRAPQIDLGPWICENRLLYSSCKLQNGKGSMLPTSEYRKLQKKSNQLDMLGLLADQSVGCGLVLQCLGNNFIDLNTFPCNRSCGTKTRVDLKPRVWQCRFGNRLNPSESGDCGQVLLDGVQPTVFGQDAMIAASVGVRSRSGVAAVSRCGVRRSRGSRAMGVLFAGCWDVRVGQG